MEPEKLTQREKEADIGAKLVIGMLLFGVGLIIAWPYMAEFRAAQDARFGRVTVEPASPLCVVRQEDRDTVRIGDTVAVVRAKTRCHGVEAVEGSRQVVRMKMNYGASVAFAFSGGTLVEIAR